MKVIALSLLVCSLASSAGAEAVFRGLSNADWKPATHLPPGAEYALLYEAPGTHGIHALVRFPSGYGVGAHRHGHDEVLVVLKGRLRVDSAGQTRTLGPGDSVAFKAGAVHSLKAATWFRNVVFTALTDRPYDFLSENKKRPLE